MRSCSNRRYPFDWPETCFVLCIRQGVHSTKLAWTLFICVRCSGSFHCVCKQLNARHESFYTLYFGAYDTKSSKFVDRGRQETLVATVAERDVARKRYVDARDAQLAGAAHIVEESFAAWTEE